MKNKLNHAITLIVVLISVLSFSTCKKSGTTDPADPNNPNPNTGLGYYFTCKVNGVAKDLKSLTLIKDPVVSPQQLYMTVALNSMNTPPIMQFTLNRKGTGFVAGLNYLLNDEDLNNFCTYTAEGGMNVYKSIATPHANNGGLSLNFTAFDSTATGTFSGTLQLEENTNTVTITEGKFRIKFMN